MGIRANDSKRDSRYIADTKPVSKQLDTVKLAATGGHLNRGHIRYFSDCHSWAGDAMIFINYAVIPSWYGRLMQVSELSRHHG